MKLTSKPLALIVFVIFFGGIALTSALGWFQTSTTKVPATFTDGAFAGQYNPADIRGSYTLGEVSSLFGIPLGDLQAAFQIPPESDPASYPVKSLEAQFETSGAEIGTESLRLFVALYKSLPYDLTSGAYLPNPAAAILRGRASLTPEQEAYLVTHSVDFNQPLPSDLPEAIASTPAPENEVMPQPTPEATQHVAPEHTVTGKTTFQEVLDWGVSQTEIEAILSSPLSSPALGIKDYANAHGLDFSSLKTELQAMIDSKTAGVP